MARSIMEHPMTWICPADGTRIPLGSWERMQVWFRNGLTRFEGAHCERGHRVIVEVSAQDIVKVHTLSTVPVRPLAPAPPPVRPIERVDLPAGPPKPPLVIRKRTR